MEGELEDLRWELDGRWKDLGITLEWIDERASWTHRDTGAPGNIDGFFQSAARLMRLCAYDYLLLGPMFFHAVVGLEAMLRLHYQATKKQVFRSLFQQAVDDGIFHDGLFSDRRPVWNGFDKRIGPGRKGHIKKLAVLVPGLRNDYFHGGYLLHPDLLFMTIQIREMADALTMPRTPEWKLAMQAARVAKDGTS